MTARTISTIAVVALTAVAVVAQDGPSVKVTVAQANIRSEPSDRAPILTQIPSGTLLPLLSVEGDWFRVRVPIGAIRLDAYISKRVVTLAPAPGDVDGISVAVVSSGALTPIAPQAATARPTSASADALAALAAELPAANAPAPADPDVRAWAWTIDGSAADRVVADRRPSFVVVFKGVAGVNVADLAPTIVRLTPVASGGRLVAAARVAADLKQDVVRSESQVLERGAVTIFPAVDLPAAQYAIVIRPSAARTTLAGADALSSTATGHVMSLVWDFAIK